MDISILLFQEIEYKLCLIKGATLISIMGKVFFVFDRSIMGKLKTVGRSETNTEHYNY